ncbi:hypothetical protein N656DRAFT_705344 [Canariomyces notabilis]|uniref:Alpha and gamma adaptin binding protein p34 n=1 Tax=Canariomyces notabilis TaxID=2074819 RepID=A0AAN6TIQ4_9PEZI|nr:hypothetical protein N656DRAFT_705344 [Canariomyces arenarius]
MEISNPRRILAVSLADSAQHLSDIIKDLTGTPPTPLGPSASLAGTTHPFPLTTQYYTATVPVWLDLISSPAEWAASFLAPEAKEVLDVLGGVVVVLPLPPAPSSSFSRREKARALVEHVGRLVKEGLGGWDWDGVGLVIGVTEGGQMDLDGEGLDEWEDLCAECGMEFVYLSRSNSRTAAANEDPERNEFGEKMGLARVREALEANDWSGGGDLTEEGSKRKGRKVSGDGDDEFDPESLDFGFDREDFVGLRKAILTGGMGDTDADDPKGDQKDDDDENLDDEKIQKVERMMLKLQAVRDASAGLPEEQRKRMARQAVGEVMREL